MTDSLHRLIQRVLRDLGPLTEEHKAVRDAVKLIESFALSMPTTPEIAPCDHMSTSIKLSADEWPQCEGCGSIFSPSEYAVLMAKRGAGLMTPREVEQNIDRITGGPTKDGVDMVNHPPHYTRGPLIPIKTGVGTNKEGGQWIAPIVHDGSRLYLRVECIDVIEGMIDPRLFTAAKYIWRVGFGGKDDDREDIGKAIWYLERWLSHPRETPPLPPAQ